MVLEKVRKKVQKLKASREARQAKRRGMTVQEYREHKAKLKKKEAQERQKFEEWEIEEKWKLKKKRAKAGKRDPFGSGFLGTLAGISENVEANVLGKKKDSKSGLGAMFRTPEQVLEDFGVQTKQRKSKKKKAR